MKTLTSLVALHGIHWAMESRIALQLWQGLQSTSVEVHMAEVEARGHEAARGEEREYGITDGVAIVSLVGPMTKATTSMSSGCSTVAARRQIRAATNDPEVRAIMLRIDSPGGSVSGTSDLADDVRAAARKKPTMAYAEDLCCSAAYWVASQCGSIVANPTAMIGSIGTYCVVQDLSGMAEAMGVKVHVIATGAHKGAGAPGAPITDEQLAEFQREVNGLNAHFLSAVSRGRKMPMTQLREVADGRVFVGQQARTLGLVDGIGSFDQALVDLRNSVGTIQKAEAERVVSADVLPIGLAAVDTTFEAADETPEPEAADSDLDIEATQVSPAEATEPEPPSAADGELRQALRLAALRSTLTLAIDAHA